MNNEEDAFSFIAALTLGFTNPKQVQWPEVPGTPSQRIHISSFYYKLREEKSSTELSEKSCFT